MNCTNSENDTLAVYYNNDIAYDLHATGSMAQRLDELRVADEQGRLVVLPLAKGNVLYRIAGDEILEECVKDILFRAVGDWSLYSHFGKTVFLTRPAAAAALAEGSKA